MNKKGEIGFGRIILLFIGAIVALALFPAIANSQSVMTDLLVVTNESSDLATLGCITATIEGGRINNASVLCNITVTGAPRGWKNLTSECYISSVTVHNSTGAQAWVEGTDYNLFASSGVVQMLNTTDTYEGQANTTLVDYSYCGDGYNTNSGARGIARTISLFAALALMAFMFVGLRNEWFNF